MDFWARGNEHLFSEIMDKLREGIIVLDSGLKVVYANNAALKMTGREEQNVLNQPVQRVFPLINSDDLSPLVPALLPQKKDEPSSYPATPDMTPPDTVAPEAASMVKPFSDVLLHNPHYGQMIVEGHFLYAPKNGEEPDAYVLLLNDVGGIKQLSALINFRENYDPLTGLHKGPVFMVRLQEALDNIRRGNVPQALLYIDLDFFQAVKNTGGVDASNTLLREAADLIRKSVGRSDVVGHLQKDDFAILLHDCSREHTDTVAKRLMGAFRKHRFLYANKEWTLTVSIGAYTLSERDTIAEMPLKKAYAACREAYKKGGNRLAFVSGGARCAPAKKSK